MQIYEKKSENAKQVDDRIMSIAGEMEYNRTIKQNK